jgi:phage tail-like protein
MPPSQKLLSNHYFKVSVPGLDIGTFYECEGLSLEIEVFEWPEGGNNEFVHQLPGRTRYPKLRLAAGMTENDAMEKWLDKTRTAAELKEVTIELRSQDGQAKRAWTFADAYPVQWIGPSVAAGAAGMGQEYLEIVHSGLKRA